MNPARAGFERNCSPVQFFEFFETIDDDDTQIFSFLIKSKKIHYTHTHHIHNTGGKKKNTTHDTEKKITHDTEKKLHMTRTKNYT